MKILLRFFVATTKNGTSINERLPNSFNYGDCGYDSPSS